MATTSYGERVQEEVLGEDAPDVTPPFYSGARGDVALLDEVFERRGLDGVEVDELEDCVQFQLGVDSEKAAFSVEGLLHGCQVLG